MFTLNAVRGIFVNTHSSLKYVRQTDRFVISTCIWVAAAILTYVVYGHRSLASRNG